MLLKKIWCAIWMAQIKGNLNGWLGCKGKEIKNKIKGGYMCVCVTGEEERGRRRGLGKSAQPEKKAELRESFRREGGPMGRRERENRPTRGRERRKGEMARSGGRRTKNGSQPATRAQPVGFPHLSVDFHPFFRRIEPPYLMGNTLGSSLYPFHPKFGEI